MVPEAATMLFINGVAFDDLNSKEGKYAMQQSVLRSRDFYFFPFLLSSSSFFTFFLLYFLLISIQKHVEDAFENVARSTGHKCVLLCDRGAMDGSAYIDRDEFVKIVRVRKNIQLNRNSLIH